MQRPAVREKAELPALAGRRLQWDGLGKTQPKTGSGFRVWGLGIGAWGLGLGAWGLGLGVWGLGLGLGSFESGRLPQASMQKP